MSITLTVKDIMTEKATDFVFSKFTEVLKDKELKDKFKIASQKYFDEIFENCNLSEEFDFEAVEEYLLDNLDNKIISIFHNIKNIGQEGRDSIREDILHEAVARGNGNKKAICKYCNSIIDFVGACLHDKISDSDKILASEITSVTNEYYKQLVKKIGEIEDIGREFLNKIEYFGSFAEQIDNIGLPRVITTSKFSYANPAIGFYGRNVEQEEIEKFMSDDRPLLFWSVTGRGGVGKSKFALHICKKYKQENWKAVWLNKNTVENINGVTRNKGYNKPLLLVCDYAGEYAESIRTLLLNLFSNTQCKIRVLLLERSGYTPASDVDSFTYSDVWYNRLLSGHNSDDMREIEYRTDSLNLDNYVLTDEDMVNILEDFSEKKLFEEDKKDIVNFTKNRLNSVSDKNNLSRSEERCLFLLFTADAFLNGNDYKSWDTNKLMDKYTERFKINLEAHYSKNICKSAYTLLAVASAIGTIDIESVESKNIFGYCISPIKDELSYNFDINNLKMFLSALCEKDTADLNIYPMLPDLVGEFFFIDIFNKISPEHKREWHTIFCSKRYQGYFCSFLRRCLNDWHSLKKFKNIIKDMFEFAKVNNYKEFIEECVNNSFFMGLSYYYTLTENDLLWIKDILLIDKNENCYLEYAYILFNASVKMSNVDDILKIANQMKDEILIEYDTFEIALWYAMVLVNATAQMPNADNILKIANQIKAEILSDYGTAEIALRYAMALINATDKMSNADDILKIANHIKDEILSEYSTAEFVSLYALALVNATSKMSNADEQLKIANQIKAEILSEYGTAKIALRYAMALV
ncbi:MAG: hypothetical protein HDT21_10190, partial [Ruminococcus sp.]|nr:hypothetical protein [Ruminococcus sp.]